MNIAIDCDDKGSNPGGDTAIYGPYRYVLL